jgi:hypothetical protein
MTEKEYDVFLSHASEDKDDIARPLYKKLIENGVKVWFDEVSLPIGASLTETIQKALSRSRYMIMIVSEIYLRKSWTLWEKKIGEELEARGTLKIIPYFYGISQSSHEIDPSLGNTMGISSGQSLDENVAKILKTLRKSQ